MLTLWKKLWESAESEANFCQYLPRVMLTASQLSLTSTRCIFTLMKYLGKLWNLSQGEVGQFSTCITLVWNWSLILSVCILSWCIMMYHDVLPHQNKVRQCCNMLQWDAMKIINETAQSCSELLSTACCSGVVVSLLSLVFLRSRGTCWGRGLPVTDFDIFDVFDINDLAMSRASQCTANATKPKERTKRLKRIRKAPQQRIFWRFQPQGTDGHWHLCIHDGSIRNLGDS